MQADIAVHYVTSPCLIHLLQSTEWQKLGQIHISALHIDQHATLLNGDAS